MLIGSKIRAHISRRSMETVSICNESLATKEKYLMRLGKSLGFLNPEGTLEDKARRI
jgi:hypothetical protein